jgi:hypothetical protein
MPRHRERTGLLVVRIWTDPAAATGIRARITRTLDVERPEAATTSVCPVDDVEAVMRSWLYAFLRAAGQRPTAGQGNGPPW